MAINFPGSPTNGQTHTENSITYYYDSTVGAWLIQTPQVFGITDYTLNTQVVFNDSGVVAGSNGLTFNTTANTLYTNNVAVTANVSATYFLGNGALLTGVVSDFSPAFDKANAANVLAYSKLANTSGVSFAGDLYFSTGNVAIGRTTITSGYSLDVVGTINASNVLVNGAPLTSGGGGVTVNNETSSSSTYYPVFTSNTTGSIAYANVDSSDLYYTPSSGTLSAKVFNSLSDITLKTDIEGFDGILLLDQINPVSFKWASNNVKSYGVIAQELEKTLPELVDTNDRGIKSVSYIPMIAMLIDTVKKQEERITKLEQLLNAK